MKHSLPTKSKQRLFPDWKLAGATIAIFWVLYLLVLIGRAFLSPSPSQMLLARVPMVGSGIILTICIYFAIQAVDAQARIRVRAAVAAGAAVLAAIAQALLIISTSHLLRNDQTEASRYETREGAIITQRGNEVSIQRHSGEQPMIFTLPRIEELGELEKARLAADAAAVWLFFFGAWSAVYLAAVSSTQVAETKRRLVAARADAQEAHVRALRYQVNPHFLFNTLNSLSSLVMTGRNEQAENMLIALSTFFRASLSLDPGENVTLEQEIELQSLYLDIEKRRFPKRLHVDIDVPDHLRQLPVPALILQPIIENAIKYGVSQSRETVTVSITGRVRDDGRADIQVFNSAPSDAQRREPAPVGTGTGLPNVCERIAAQYGSRGECRFGPVEGGYRVDLIIPREDLA